MTAILKSFQIQITEEQILHLHSRLDQTLWPPSVGGSAWQHGMDEHILRELIKRWRNDYDWTEREASFNRWPQWIAMVDKQPLHFIHVRSAVENAPALLLLHGWPDSFLRYLKVIPLLSHCQLVIPSLPGFAFSGLPEKGYVNNAEIACLMHRLMTEVLGYGEYVASGGDVGRGVALYLAQYYPSQVRGLHLTDVGMAQELIQKPEEQCTSEEKAYKQAATAWLTQESAYIRLQSTKFQTLAYALADSPVALAAWIGEKYHTWSDWQSFQINDLLDECSLYWFTRSAATSIRVYHGNVFTLPQLLRPTVPVGFTHFAYDVLPVPRSYIESHYPIVRYDDVPHGGHFTAMEQPEAFARSLSAFVASLP